MIRAGGKAVWPMLGYDPRNSLGDSVQFGRDSRYRVWAVERVRVGDRADYVAVIDRPSLRHLPL